MTFEQIPIRMLQLGVDRAWLANACDYSLSTLGNAIAPNGSNKTDKALRRIWEALDREEERQKGLSTSNEKVPFRVVLEPDKERFDRWMQAVYSKPGRTFDDWATTGLDALADQELSPAVEFVKPQPAFYEIPLLRAAAGSPILADAETVEVDQDHGTGRFMLELRGDSMAPRFADRQRIVLRDKATLKRPVLKYGEFYLFVHEGQSTFKQWAKDKAGNKVLRSLNPKHEDIPADEDTNWIGWYDASDNAKSEQK
jgi:SOS-response transcriptional repressor LexA